MKLRHLGVLLALNCGWAAIPTIATLFEGRLSPAQFVFLRYGFALLAILAVWPWLPGRLPRGGDFWRTVAMGVAVFSAGHLLQIAGMQRSEAGDASILLAIDPLVTSLGAALFLHERIPLRRWAGFATAMAGVIWMSLVRPDAALPGLLANLFIVLSFVTEAVWSVVGKPLIGRWGIPKVTGLALAAGMLANTALLVPDLPAHGAAFARLHLESWLVLAFLGIALSAVGYSAWYWVIREAPVSAASMTVYLQPVLGTGLAVLLTDDRLHAGHAIGAAMIGLGLFLGIREPRSRAGAAAIPTAPLTKPRNL